MKETEQIPYYAVDIPFDIVYRKNRTAAPVKPHTHNALEIYFTLTDLPDVLLNDTLSGVSSGSLVVIPPHCVHQLFTHRLTVYERYIITINSNWLGTVLSGDPQLMPYNTPSAAPAVIPLSAKNLSVLQNALEAYMRSAPAAGIGRYSDFFTLLTLIDSLISKGLQKSSASALSISPSQKRVNEIIAFINRHITEPIGMGEIADAFHLNKDYLGRLFKAHTHATIGHYIAAQRAGLAQSMLAGGRTVSEVQEALGFTSYAYFFRFFKKMTGVSPSHYRKSEFQ